MCFITKSCNLSRYSPSTNFMTHLLSVCMENMSKKYPKKPLFREILTFILSTTFENPILIFRETFFTRLCLLFVFGTKSRQIVTWKMWPILPFPPGTTSSLKPLQKMSFLRLWCKMVFWPSYGKIDTTVARLLGVLDLMTSLFLQYIVIDLIIVFRDF